MLNKVFKYSAKNGKFGAINYLLGNKNRSTKPELLRGNEAITRALLEKTTGARAYTAGVCSFNELAKDISLDVQNEIMNMYEETIMSGFPKEHYDMIWIRHTDKNGRLELNWHIVNQDLVTNRVLTPYYYKQDQYRLDLLKQIINDKYKLESPDDPRNRRDFTSANNFGCRKEAQENINMQVMDAIVNGIINNQTEVAIYLNSLSGVSVNRVTKSGISIKITNNDKIKQPIRFKSAAFTNEFSGLEFAIEAKKRAAIEFNQRRDERLRENIEKLRLANEKFSISRQRLLCYPKPRHSSRKSDEGTRNNNRSIRAEAEKNINAKQRNNRNEQHENKKFDEDISYYTDVDDNYFINRDLDRERVLNKLMQEKKLILNKLKIYNDEYIRNIERRRKEVTGITENKQPRIKKLLGAGIKELFGWLGEEFKRRNKAVAEYITVNAEKCASAYTTRSFELNAAISAIRSRECAISKAVKQFDHVGEYITKHIESAKIINEPTVENKTENTATKHKFKF